MDRGSCSSGTLKYVGDQRTLSTQNLPTGGREGGLVSPDMRSTFRLLWSCWAKPLLSLKEWGLPIKPKRAEKYKGSRSNFLFFLNMGI